MDVAQLHSPSSSSTFLLPLHLLFSFSLLPLHYLLPLLHLVTSFVFSPSSFLLSSSSLLFVFYPLSSHPSSSCHFLCLLFLLISLHLLSFSLSSLYSFIFICFLPSSSLPPPSSLLPPPSSILSFLCLWFLHQLRAVPRFKYLHVGCSQTI